MVRLQSLSIKHGPRGLQVNKVLLYVSLKGVPWAPAGLRYRSLKGFAYGYLWAWPVYGPYALPSNLVLTG